MLESVDIGLSQLRLDAERGFSALTSAFVNTLKRRWGM